MDAKSARLCLLSFASYFPGAFILAWWVGDLQYHWRELPEYQFGWVVLLLAGYLVAERWSGRPREPVAASWSGCLAFALCGAPFVLVAELYKQAIGNSPAASFCLSIGCVQFLVAHLACLHGWATVRHFLFPILFFCFAVPLPGILWSPVVLGLKTLITQLNVETLNLLGVPAVQQTNVIQLPNGLVGIDEACSGIRSLQSSLMISLFIGELTLRRARSKWLLMLGAATLAVVGNFSRSFFLSLTAYHSGPDVLNQFHDAAGWSVFVFTGAGLAVVAITMRAIENSVNVPGGRGAHCE